ncbi:HAE1 family hydrophobic/amphiphilic exporter-1 [Anaerosolibacter carboniphilus]|uniref:HAE1 family hydrophobic/amphiphilic exporter-1 n=1 Tax=Anaerosolibacter carboniphilus TaxID=1417629 RepID=A0A841KMX4_9FIRM|nr:efflux RND transporter permease subunit [Anaerosolibacter carboniphilus]MBB6214621.1 HAE1 family hydrophobic/amphiphilic exporter-1 [Anaerosolibacter carboniphilus]
MNLSSLSVKRPVTVIMLTLIVAIYGIISFSKLPIDLYPSFEIPVGIVMTTYSGVGPQEIEELITKPLEQSVGTVGDIKTISSSSSEGRSMIIAEFNDGTDMDFAALEMREKVDLIKGRLPDGADAPMVIKIDPNAMAVMEISITNGEDLSKLQRIAEDTIQPRLERISGIASVSVSGGYEDQIEIAVNQEKLQGYGLTLNQLAQKLQAENLNMPGGEVKKGIQKLTLKTVGEFQTVDEIKSLPIALPAGGVIYLQDIAEVEMKHKDITAITRTNGKRSVNISLQKQSGSNTVQVADKALMEIEKLKKEFPDLEINVVLDQSEYIKDSIDSVKNNAMMGAVLAIVILYLFLRNIRTTFIIGVSIPVSIIASFILIYFNGITLNMMTLGGLALGVGMLVDNSIVVLENIYRFRQEGYSRIEAASEGAKEVGMAVIASTLTTVAVFLPMAFVEGMVGAIFKEFALTVCMSLAASLVIALTVVPMLSSKLLKIDEAQGKVHHGRFRLFDFLYDGFDKVFANLEKAYKRILAWALKHRKSTVIIGIVVFVVGMGSIPLVGAEFFPTTDEGEFSVSVSLPTGSELEDTDQVVMEIEGILEQIGEIETVYSTAGSAGGMFSSNSGTNSGRVSGVLKELSQRERSTAEVADEVRNKVKDIPGAEIKVEASSSSMGRSSAPISIKIKGDDLEVLKKIGKDFKNIVSSVEGTREVESDLEEGIPEVHVKLNRSNASQYGLTASQVSSAVRGIIAGQTATTYKFEGDEIDVVIKGDPIYQDSISNLEQLEIQTPAGISVPLNQVADISVERGPVTISRESQVRMATVSSQIMGRDLKSVSADVEKKLSQYDMPEGYTYDIGGENEEMMEAFADLFMALILAVALVYMILASQFESLLHPFTIMMSVPLAFSGGLLGLLVTGRSLNVTGFIGLIMLAGIVVNNAIVLVDYINIRREKGEERNEAITNAGPTRLRPILMTTLTTVLGLLPLALGIGEGAEMQASMATVVVAGLTLSTLLTLVFIPVLYTMFDDFSHFIKRKLSKRKSAEA